MSGSGRDALPEVREWSGYLEDLREWLGSPPGCLGVDRRPSRMREWSGVVWRPL